MKNLIVLLFCVQSSFALAWGENEQNLLKGFVGGVILKSIFDDNQRNYNRSYNRSNHTANECLSSNPYLNNPRAAAAYEKGCLQRISEKQRQLENEAYNYGYHGY